MRLDRAGARVRIRDRKESLRHPQYTGPIRLIAERVVRGLLEQIATTPALAEMARRRWDPQFDVEVGQEADMNELKAQIAHEFYSEVCARAERKMEQTHVLEGAHYAAMQEVIREWAQG